MYRKLEMVISVGTSVANCSGGSFLSSLSCNALLFCSFVDSKAFLYCTYWHGGLVSLLLLYFPCGEFICNTVGALRGNLVLMEEFDGKVKWGAGIALWHALFTKAAARGGYASPPPILIWSSSSTRPSLPPLTHPIAWV